MPVAEFLRDASGGYPFLGLELQCLMAYPDDQDKRLAARAVLIFEALGNSGAETVQLPTELLRQAKSSSGAAATRKEITGKVKGGTAAGQVLLDLLEAHLHGEAPRVAVAVQRIVSERFTYRTHGGDEETMRAVRSVENARKEFKSVAHLWAALVAAHRKLPMMGDTFLFLSTQPLSFLAIAMDLLARASVLMSDNGSKAVPLFDPDEFWTPPSEMALPDVLTQAAIARREAAASDSVHAGRN